MRVKGLILLTSVCSADSMVSSVKIARFLQSVFKFPIYCWKSAGPVVDADWLIYVNSSTLFTDEKYRVFTQQLMRRAKNVIYVQNDYKLPFPSKWRRAAEHGGSPIFYWSAVERVVQKKGGDLLDWNRLTYNPVSGRRIIEKNALFYYGAYRLDRAPVFRRYFDDPKVPTVISVPTVPQRKKFEAAQLDRRIELIVDKSDVVKQLRDYAATLYIEDPYSSRNFTCPANRFYEALSAGTAIAIDAPAKLTFQHAGIEVKDDDVVESPKDLRVFIKHGDLIAKSQARRWRRDYVGELKRQVLRAAKRLGI